VSGVDDEAAAGKRVQVTPHDTKTNEGRIN